MIIAGLRALRADRRPPAVRQRRRAPRCSTTIPTRSSCSRKFGFKVFYGDATRLDLLHAAGAEQARLLVIAIDDVEDSLALVDRVREHFPELPIVARARNVSHWLELADRGVDGGRARDVRVGAAHRPPRARGARRRSVRAREMADASAAQRDDDGRAAPALPRRGEDGADRRAAARSSRKTCAGTGKRRPRAAWRRTRTYCMAQAGPRTSYACKRGTGGQQGKRQDSWQGTRKRLTRGTACCAVRRWRVSAPSRTRQRSRARAACRLGPGRRQARARARAAAPVDRPGSRGRRRLRQPARATTCSPPPTAATATPSPRAPHRPRMMAELFGRATGNNAARAARCTSPTSRSACWAPTAWWPRASRSPTGAAHALKIRGTPTHRCLLLRRRRGQPRAVPRRPELGPGLPAAGAVRLRGQPDRRPPRPPAR